MDSEFCVSQCAASLWIKTLGTSVFSNSLNPVAPVISLSLSPMTEPVCWERQSPACRLWPRPGCVKRGPGLGLLPEETALPACAGAQLRTALPLADSMCTFLFCQSVHVRWHPAGTCAPQREDGVPVLQEGACRPSASHASRRDLPVPKVMLTTEAGLPLSLPWKTKPLFPPVPDCAVFRRQS